MPVTYEATFKYWNLFRLFKIFFYTIVFNALIFYFLFDYSLWLYLGFLFVVMFMPVATILSAKSMEVKKVVFDDEKSELRVTTCDYLIYPVENIIEYNYLWCTLSSGKTVFPNDDFTSIKILKKKDKDSIPSVSIVCNFNVNSAFSWYQFQEIVEKIQEICTKDHITRPESIFN